MSNDQMGIDTFTQTQDTKKEPNSLVEEVEETFVIKFLDFHVNGRPESAD